MLKNDGVRFLLHIEEARQWHHHHITETLFISTIVSELTSFPTKRLSSILQTDLTMYQCSRLNDLTTNKIKGIRIRTKTEWIEETEKNSTFFANLEKKRAQEKKQYNNLNNQTEKQHMTKVKYWTK